MRCYPRIRGRIPRGIRETSRKVRGTYSHREGKSNPERALIFAQNSCRISGSPACLLRRVRGRWRGWALSEGPGLLRSRLCPTVYCCDLQLETSGCGYQSGRLRPVNYQGAQLPFQGRLLVMSWRSWFKFDVSEPPPPHPVSQICLRLGPHRPKKRTHIRFRHAGRR